MAEWYRADPAGLKAAVTEALVVQPLMWLEDEGGRLVFRGRFEIRHDDELLEAFAVDVQLSPASARDLPTVWETGGRIPRVTDPHHVNSDNGSLCVLLPDWYWYYFPDGLSLAEYLAGPLREHLAGQACVLSGKAWPVGEWKHGLAGTLQFFHEVLGTADEPTLWRLLTATCDPRVKGHWDCPCGSRKKLRQCHGAALRKLSTSPTFEPWAQVFDRVRRERRKRSDRNARG